MVFHWSLSGSKSPQDSMTLSILADLNNVVFWMVTVHPLISKSCSTFINRSLIVPRAPYTISITVTFMLHSFFQSPGKILNLLLAFFQFYSVVSRDSKIHNSANSLFLCWLLLGLVVLPSFYYDHYSFRVFQISISWWYFTGDWVTASLLKSPAIFSVFWPSSIMLLFGWSPLVRQLPNPPGSLITL